MTNSPDDSVLTADDFDYLDPLLDVWADNPFTIGRYLGTRNPGKADIEKLADGRDVSPARVWTFIKVAAEVPISRQHKGVAFGVYEQLVKVKDPTKRWALFDERANKRDWTEREMKKRVGQIVARERNLPRYIDKGGLRSGPYKVDSEFRKGDEVRADRVKLMVHGEGAVEILNLGNDMLGVQFTLIRNTLPPLPKTVT